MAHTDRPTEPVSPWALCLLSTLHQANIWKALLYLCEPAHWGSFSPKETSTGSCLRDFALAPGLPSLLGQASSNSHGAPALPAAGAQHTT